MSARIYTLPVRDHHVAGERPDWANGERQRIADRAYALGVHDTKQRAFLHGFVAAMVTYAVGTMVLIGVFSALGAHV